jgi:hypothetical protein
MIDPAVLGTLRVGLDAIQAEANDSRPRRSHPSRKSIRVAVADSLRRLAAALDRPAVNRPAIGEAATLTDS